MFEYIDYTDSDGIALVRFDRPDVRNALEPDILTEIETALERVESDDDIFAVVLTGNGTAFSAGGDIDAVQEWQRSTLEDFSEELARFQAVTEQLRSMGTPSIAAVNGPAVGAGCDIALACDIRYMSPNAVLKEGFVTIGLVSGDGGAWLLSRLIGESQAKEYLLTGNPIDSEEAADIGLISGISDDSVAAAREFAEQLTALPARAIQRTNKLATSRPETFSDHLERATDSQWVCLQDEEHRETLDARLDNRDPNLDRPR